MLSAGVTGAHNHVSHFVACTTAQVEVLWVVNQRQADWEAALPKETSQLLQSARGDSTGALGDIASQVAGFVNEELGTGVLELWL
jgi:hypothetical protein